MMDLFDNEWILRVHEKTICAQARTEGIAEGRTEGKAEEKNAIAKKMLGKSMPDDLIAELSGLTLNEVNELKAQLVQ